MKESVAHFATLVMTVPPYRRRLRNPCGCAPDLAYWTTGRGTFIAECIDCRASWSLRAEKIHPPSWVCQTPECAVCGERDCPNREPLHYDKDGCPACDVLRATTVERDEP